MRDVFFLTSGQFRAPAVAVHPPGARAPGLRGALAPALLSNTVAVCVREDESVVLVDCGWSKAVLDDPVAHLGRARVAFLGLDARPGEAIATQLQALGVAPARVRAVVATHLHPDHVGGIADFPNAELITVERELTAYRRSPGRGYRAEDLARHGRIRVAALSEGPTYGFPCSADLHGDGSIVLLDARGHTRGSVAVALRARDACFVHVGDAVYQRWEHGLAPAGPCNLARGLAWSRGALERTYASLRACEADPRRPVLVPSHDAAVFAQLPHVPTAAEAGAPGARTGVATTPDK